MSRPKALRDRTTELVLGYILLTVATWMIYDAYEGRGKPRPFIAHLLP